MDRYSERVTELLEQLRVVADDEVVLALEVRAYPYSPEATQAHWDDVSDSIDRRKAEILEALYQQLCLEAQEKRGVI